MQLRYSLICVALLACSQSHAETAQSCVERVSQSEIVRVDEDNQRYFLAASNKTVDLLANQPKEIFKCFEGSDWAGKWSLSVFSAPKFAGYMDEENIIQFHENDEWALAYLAEFDGTSGTLVENPAREAIIRIEGK